MQSSTQRRTRRRGPSSGRGGNRNQSRNNNSRRSGGGSNRKQRGAYIDPSRFIQAAKPITIDVYQPTHTFDDFNISEIVKNNLRAQKFTVPTQIQDQAIPVGLDGKDVVGIANTGTGKTVAFLLPLIENLLRNKGEKALIIAPTRELALQIQKEARWIARGGRLFDILLIGGVPIRRQLSDLKRRPQIVIGTPGRLKDHLEKGSLDLSTVTTIVLDEVDRMLDMGFIRDIRVLLAELPERRQSLFFSATISPEIDSLIKTFTHSPETIMARTAETSENVEQSIIHYFEKTDKTDKLLDLLKTEEVDKTLIFCEMKHSAQRLSKMLEDKGYRSDAIHGNKSQGQRQRALKNFQDDKIDILVATDVAARGIDVDSITHVINFDVPQTYADYTHRIGRTGRNGSIGRAVTFVTH